MSAIDTAYLSNSLSTFYQIPGADSFDNSTMVLGEGSTFTYSVLKATFKGFLIESYATGNFSTVFPAGTPVTTMLNSGATGTISNQKIYINGQLFEELKYSTPISLGDSFYAERDSTSTTYKKILAGNDVFVGSTVVTNAPDDKVAGYDGNDVFYGYGDGGSDLFDGGNGVDTSVYRGASTNYTLTKNVSFWNPSTNRSDLVGLQVFDKTKLDGTDGLVNVERLKFTDTNIALDVGPTQNAGSVYMIYKAAFNRAPDASGMGYWLAQKDAGSNIVTNIAQGFVNSAEFTAKYGTNPSNASYIDKLYQNVLGRSGDAGGIAYWNQQLDNGSVSKAAALAAFATLPEGASNVASLIANGIPYTEFLG